MRLHVAGGKRKRRGGGRVGSGENRSTQGAEGGGIRRGWKHEWVGGKDDGESEGVVWHTHGFLGPNLVSEDGKAFGVLQVGNAPGGLS